MALLGAAGPPSSWSLATLKTVALCSETPGRGEMWAACVTQRCTAIVCFKACAEPPLASWNFRLETQQQLLPASP